MINYIHHLKFFRFIHAFIKWAKKKNWKTRKTGKTEKSKENTGENTEKKKL